MQIKFFQLGIIGVTGSGKSYLTQELLFHVSKIHKRVIVIDDLNQLRCNGFILCNNIEQFVQAIINKKQFKIIYRNEYAYYDDVIKIIWNLPDTVLFIDELSILCDVHNINQDLKHIAQRGRLKNISFVWNTQRPANINRHISSQTEFIVSFRLSEYNDLRYFYIDKKTVINLNLQNLKIGEYRFLRGEKEALESRIFYKF